MRKLKELYQLLLDNYEEGGICWNITNLEHRGIISYPEKQLLANNFINENIPDSFRQHPTYMGGWFWWTSEGDEQRKLFIKHLIDKQK